MTIVETRAIAVIWYGLRWRVRPQPPGDSAVVAALRDLAAGRSDLLAGEAGVLGEFTGRGQTFRLPARDLRL